MYIAYMIITYAQRDRQMFFLPRFYWPLFFEVELIIVLPLC